MACKKKNRSHIYSESSTELLISTAQYNLNPTKECCSFREKVKFQSKIKISVNFDDMLNCVIHENKSILSKV